MSSRKVSTETARIRTPKQGPNPAYIALAVVILAIAVVVIFFSGGEPEEEVPFLPSPTAVAPPAAGRATPISGAAPAGSSDDSSPFGLATETPEPTETPVPQASAEACISFRWTAGLQAGSENPLPVEVTVQNNCTTDLEAINQTFEARGYRGQEQVQSMTGAVNGRLGKGESTTLTIMLPGTPGGYDRIDLQPTN